MVILQFIMGFFMGIYLMEIVSGHLGRHARIMHQMIPRLNFTSYLHKGQRFNLS